MHRSEVEAAKGKTKTKTPANNGVRRGAHEARKRHQEADNRQNDVVSPNALSSNEVRTDHAGSKGSTRKVRGSKRGLNKAASLHRSDRSAELQRSGPNLRHVEKAYREIVEPTTSAKSTATDGGSCVDANSSSPRHHRTGQDQASTTMPSDDAYGLNLRNSERKGRESSLGHRWTRKQPSSATSTATSGAADPPPPLADQTRAFIMPTESISSKDQRPSVVNDDVGAKRLWKTVETSESNKSFSLDTERIIQLQNMTNEADIKDMIRRIQRSMSSPERPTGGEESTSTTITLPVEPPPSSSTEDETPSSPKEDTKRQNGSVSTGTLLSFNDGCPSKSSEDSMKLGGIIKQIGRHWHTEASTGTLRSTKPSSQTSASLGRTGGEHSASTMRSQKPDSSDSGEEESYQSVWVAVCCASIAAVLAVLVLTALLLRTRLSHGRGSSALSGRYLKDLSGVCGNPSCRKALALLVESMDASISPCEDFYRYTCGRWRAKNPKRLSYADENQLSFLDRIHRSLTRMSLLATRRGAGARPIRGSGCAGRLMADFYVSCLQFVRHPPMLPLPALLRRVGIEASRWVTPTSFRELLARVVSACLHTGLASVISVRQNRKGGDIFIEVGQTIRHSLEDSDKDHDTVSLYWFIEKALRELEFSLPWSRVSELDASIESIRRKADGSFLSDSFQIAGSQQLPGPLMSLSWNALLRQAQENQTSFDSNNHPGTLSFHVRGSKDIGEILHLLDLTDLYLASAYTLLVSAAQLVQYATPLLLSNAGLEDHAVAVCLRATARRFPVDFPQWVAAVVETPRARAHFRGMVAALRNALGLLGKDGVPYNKSAAAVEFRIEPTAERNKSGIACLKRRLSSRDFSTDFIGNLILLSKEDIFLDAMEPDKHIAKVVPKNGMYQLRSSVEWSTTGTSVVPSVYLTGDLLNAEASEPSLDLPTVGVPLLMSWAEATVAHDDDWKRDVVSCGECLRWNQRVNHSDSNEAVGEEFPKRELLSPWAIKVALCASAVMTKDAASGAPDGAHLNTSAGRTTPSEASDSARTRLFFQRLCLAKCGDPLGASACNYATGSLEFAVSFGCEPRRKRSGCPCADIVTGLAFKLPPISNKCFLI